MPLISLILTLMMIGLALYLINVYVPMAQPIKTILNVFVVVVVCLWLLGVFGLYTDITVPRVR